MFETISKKRTEKILKEYSGGFYPVDPVYGNDQDQPG